MERTQIPVTLSAASASPWQSHEFPSADDLLSHVGWIRALAGGLTADDAWADDLTQETWIAASQNRASQSGSLRAWLAAILHNLARQDWRSEGARARRQQAVASVEALPSSDELLQRIEQQRMLVDLVTQLGESQRTVVILHYYEGLTAAEIARRLGEKPGTVRQRLKRALDGLREELDGRYGGREAWLSALTPLVKLTPAVPPVAGGVLLGSVFVLKKAIVLAVVLLGREVGKVFRDLSEAARRMLSASTGEHHVGPLLPGSYRVHVLTRSGAAADKPARVKHGQERKLTLRIKSAR